MEFVADFHIHSKYSRATSKDMDVEHLAYWAKLKGIQLIGTGDFTHHLWLEELRSKLEDKGNGLYEYKTINFILSSEISSIYSKNNRGYRIHNIIFAPSFKTVDKINARLAGIGNLASDGRPILGLDAAELARIIFDIDENCVLVPAHIYTPWFSVFGSMSGFDRIEDCFEEQTPKIFALETGLSSDPKMSWRLSTLDKYALISNSDSHCIHPDTKIYTINGKPTAINELVSLKVASIDFIRDLRQRSGNVSKLHKIPSPPFLYKIKTRSKEIITTDEHRFFVLYKEEIVEKRALDLKIGDLVACLRQTSDKGKSNKLPSFILDHELKIIPRGINYLRMRRIKSKKSQKEIGKYIGVREDCVWIFEKLKIKTPKESFINKYCEYLGINKGKFKKKFIIQSLPSEKSPEFTNEAFCQILGYIIGDGGIEYSNGKIRYLSLTDKDFDLLSSYRDLIRKTFNIEGALRKKKGNSNSLRFPDYFAEYFKNIDPKILAPSPKRQIPEFIFSLPKREIASFIGGLFDAEGTCGHHFVSFCSSSSILVEEIQFLLLKFGLQAYIYPDFEKNKKKWRYQLNIYSKKQLENFAKEIKFNCDIKRKKLEEYLALSSQSSKNSFTDQLPFKKEISRIKEELGVSCYDIPGRLYYYLRRDNTLKRENIKEFVKIFSRYLTKLSPHQKSVIDKIKKFSESDIIWEDVQRVRKVKSDCKFVYDLTIPQYENYVASGFITHNSPQKIGREANVFNCELDYKAIREVLRTKDKSRFLYTIEFYPEEGKYHYDGHRLCEVRFSPQESNAHKNLCPKCGKPLTIGVMNRVDQLADRPEGFKPDNAIPFKNLIPLDEIIADVKGMGKASKAVEQEYRGILSKFGTEFEVLGKVPQEDLRKGMDSRIAEAIIRARQGRVHIAAGYDGEYGKISIFGDDDKPKKHEEQLSLF